MIMRTESLKLPRRYEILESEAKKESVEITRIIQRVEDAEEHFQKAMEQVVESKLGRFELLYGEPGVGKTTFLKTLSSFFIDVKIYEIPENLPLKDIADYIVNNRDIKEKTPIYIMFNRDNQKVKPDDNDAECFFEELRKLFRTRNGEVLVIWPITDFNSAKSLSEIAWRIGKDSIVDIENKGIFNFSGIEKDKYYDVADITTSSLNVGKSLESFGITKQVAAPLLKESNTLGEYFNRLTNKSSEVNKTYKNRLMGKIIPKVWVVLAGDDSYKAYSTVTSLTSGGQNRLDTALILEMLDSNNDSNYIKEWKNRRDDFAYIVSMLDVRLIELPPNVSLAAIRAFGIDEVKSDLVSKVCSESVAITTIESSRLYSLITGEKVSGRQYSGTEPETKNEYMRIQKKAKSQDKPLNKALASAFEKAFNKNSLKYTVYSEKQNMVGFNMKPDIQIHNENNEVICLEMTWRSSVSGASGTKKGVNTMSTGHIKQYILEKILDYVTDLGI